MEKEGFKAQWESAGGLRKGNFNHLNAAVGRGVQTLYLKVPNVRILIK